MSLRQKTRDEEDGTAFMLTILEQALIADPESGGKKKNWHAYAVCLRSCVYEEKATAINMVVEIS